MKTDITAVILAGGRGSRLGGQDKGLISINKIPLIGYVIQAIAPQVEQITISANRHEEEYRQFQLPVMADTMDDYAGPLAGILTALSHVKTEWLLVIPADSPFISSQLAKRLYHAAKSQNALIAMAHNGERLQPIFSLIHKSLLQSLTTFLEQGERKAQIWMQQQPHTVVDFSDQANSFININTDDDLNKAKEILSQV